MTRSTLRVYEREGVIQPPARQPGNHYRDYPADTVQRLEAVRQLKEIGFTLREIALLLSDRDAAPIEAETLRRLAVQQLEEIDRRIARLHAVREVVALVAAGDAHLIDDPDCRFLHRFLSAR